MAKNEPLTAEQLAEIKARAEAATPGPWKRFHMDRFSINNEPLEKHICGVSQESEHDAAFIAHAREDVPALLAEVERLRAAVGHLLEKEEWFITHILKKDLFLCPMPEGYKCEQRDGLFGNGKPQTLLALCRRHGDAGKSGGIRVKPGG